MIELLQFQVLYLQISYILLWRNLNTNLTLFTKFYIMVLHDWSLPMNIETRVAALKEKHTALDYAIHQEEVRPHPDDNTISTLKKQKLQLKDEIQRAAAC